MKDVQNSLMNLRNYAIEQENHNNSFQNYKTAVVEKIQSILTHMGGIQVQQELQGSFNEIYNELSVLKGKCEGEDVSEQFPAKIQRINGLIQIHFHTVEFSDAEKNDIKQFQWIVDFFRITKEKIALGEFGDEAQSMVIDNDSFECIPQFAVLSVLNNEIEIQLDRFKEEGKKIIGQETVKTQFTTLYDQLDAEWKNLDGQNKNLIYKKLAGQELVKNGEDGIEDSILKLLFFVKEITQLLMDQPSFKPIMKGASVSKEMMERELAKLQNPQAEAASLYQWDNFRSFPLPLPIPVLGLQQLQQLPGVLFVDSGDDSGDDDDNIEGPIDPDVLLEMQVDDALRILEERERVQQALMRSHFNSNPTPPQ